MAHCSGPFSILLIDIDCSGIDIVVTNLLVGSISWQQNPRCHFPTMWVAYPCCWSNLRNMGQDNKRIIFGLPWQEGDWGVQPSGFLWPKNAVLSPSVNRISAAHQSRPMIGFESKIWRCTWSVCRLAGRKTVPTPTLLWLAWATE